MKHIWESKIDSQPVEEQKEIDEDLIELEEPKIFHKISSEKGKEIKNLMSDEGTLITKKEDDEIINVSWDSYWNYFKEGYLWVVILFIVVPLISIECWCLMILQSLTAEWMDHFEETGSFQYYFWKFFYINMIHIFTILLAYFIIWYYSLIVSNRFFKKMANKIIKAPINLYFDVTPSGWILNRFSKDMQLIDDDLGFNTFNLLDWALSVIFTLYVACLISFWILTSLPFMLLLIFLFSKYYLGCYWELVRLEQLSFSPIISHLGEGINGSSTIWAYGR